ncbi:Transmembrane protein [Parasponia andersonii]|uniref:Transmembrane protein n=1 Tax=Parasponia andersonii TaxID=3476 RepID=A0A2P5DT76_PARAD|nr:Transmembrane protein [Parasponia andersonii]
MATNSREARRRKILERGSDRLALITGQIKNLPDPSPSLSASTDLHPLNHDSLPSSEPLISHHQDSQSNLPDTINVSPTPHGEDRASSPVLQEENHRNDAGSVEGDFGGSRLLPPLSEFETNKEPIRSPASEGSFLNSSLADRSSSVSTLATERRVESQTQKYKFFTPNQISSALAATERTRLFCSIALALLVVLSYLGFPILGSNFIKSIISSRPLYLLLLTNATVVLAQLLRIQGSSAWAGRGENKTQPAGGNDLAAQLGRTLEIGLLIQKVADAMFMNSAVYAVIVVCGVSFAQQFR